MNANNYENHSENSVVRRRCLGTDPDFSAYWVYQLAFDMRVLHNKQPYYLSIMRMLGPSCLCISNELGFSWAALLNLAGFTLFWDRQWGWSMLNVPGTGRPLSCLLLISSPGQLRRNPCGHGNIAKRARPSARPLLNPFRTGDNAEVRGWGWKSQGWSLLPCPWGQALHSYRANAKCRKGWRTTTDAICQQVCDISDPVCSSTTGDHSLSHLSGEEV